MAQSSNLWPKHERCCQLLKGHTSNGKHRVRCMLQASCLGKLQPIVSVHGMASTCIVNLTCSHDTHASWLEDVIQTWAGALLHNTSSDGRSWQQNLVWLNVVGETKYLAGLCFWDASPAFRCALVNSRIDGCCRGVVLIFIATSHHVTTAASAWDLLDCHCCM